MCSGLDLFQMLEGELTEVIALFETNRVDMRHTMVQCLLCKNVSKWLFPEWGMTIADLDAKSVINIDRMAKMLDEIRAHSQTSQHTLEARMLLNDFRQQIAVAA